MHAASATRDTSYLNTNGPKSSDEQQTFDHARCLSDSAVINKEEKTVPSIPVPPVNAYFSLCVCEMIHVCVSESILSSPSASSGLLVSHSRLFFFTVCGDELIKRCGRCLSKVLTPPTLVNTAVTSDCLLNALE